MKSRPTFFFYNFFFSKSFLLDISHNRKEKIVSIFTSMKLVRYTSRSKICEKHQNLNFKNSNHALHCTYMYL